MCLILIAFGVHPRYRLVLAANRDEYYNRPTSGASFWEEAPELFAGRDLLHGGTWLGITREGRIAALTNYRDPAAERKEAFSRGTLVSGFLNSRQSADEYLEKLRGERDAYNGYNLLFGDVEHLVCYSNRSNETVRLRPGIHGLSNHLIDTPWPKVERGRERLSQLVTREDLDTEELFALLADTRQASDQLLPDTGIPHELERLLSSIFIESPSYGTRASTLLLVDATLRATFIERSYQPGGESRTRTIDFPTRRPLW